MVLDGIGDNSATSVSESSRNSREGSFSSSVNNEEGGRVNGPRKVKNEILGTMESIPAKRRRVTRACDECRKKKVKCDGQLPCVHCTVYTYTCTYDLPSKRSGMQSTIMAPATSNSNDGEFAEIENTNNTTNNTNNNTNHINVTTYKSNPITIKREDNSCQVGNELLQYRSLIHELFPSTGTIGAMDTRKFMNLLKSNISNDPEKNEVYEKFNRLIGETVQEYNEDSSIYPHLVVNSRLHTIDSTSSIDIVDNIDEPEKYIKNTEIKLILPPKKVALQFVKNAWEHCCVLLRFYHRPTFMRDFDLLYALDVKNYSQDQINFLPLCYATIAVGVLFSEKNNVRSTMTSSVSSPQGVHYNTDEMKVSPMSNTSAPNPTMVGGVTDESGDFNSNQTDVSENVDDMKQFNLNRINGQNRENGDGNKHIQSIGPADNLINVDNDSSMMNKFKIVGQQNDLTQEEVRPWSSDEGYKFFLEAKRLVGMTDPRTLNSIQTIIMLFIFLQCSARLSECYSFIGIAMRRALREGLHRVVDSPTTTFNPIMIEMRKRVFFTIYKLDIYINSMLGLPRSISTEDFDQTLPVELSDEFITESGYSPEKQNGVLSSAGISNQNTKLLLILAEIVQKLYPVKQANNIISHEVVTKLEIKLKDWVENLPHELKPGLKSVPKGYERANRLLHLSFLHVQIILYRPFIYYLSKHLKTKPDVLSQQRAKNSITVARTAIHLAKEMVSKNLLTGSYWYGNYTIFFSVAGLLYYIHEAKLTTKEDAQGYCEILKDARLGRGVLLQLKDSSSAANRTFNLLNKMFEKLNSRTIKMASDIMANRSQQNMYPTQEQEISQSQSFGVDDTYSNLYQSKFMDSLTFDNAYNNQAAPPTNLSSQDLARMLMQADQVANIAVPKDPILPENTAIKDNFNDVTNADFKNELNNINLNVTNREDKPGTSEPNSNSTKNQSFRPSDEVTGQTDESSPMQQQLPMDNYIKDLFDQLGIPLVEKYGQKEVNKISHD